jgi:phenylalanyl-tRNA synthetase beta chain
MAMLPQPESQPVGDGAAASGGWRDYQEVVNYSFVEAAWEKDFAANHAGGPGQSDRQPDGRDALDPDRRPGRQPGGQPQAPDRRVRVFEIGRCFLREAGAGPVDGFPSPCAWLAWRRARRSPSSGARPPARRFLRSQGRCRGLVRARRVPSFERSAHPALHPGPLRRRSGSTGSASASSANCIRAGCRNTNWVRRRWFSNSNCRCLLGDAVAGLCGGFALPGRDARPGPGGAIRTPQAGQPLLAGLRAAAPAIVRDVALFDQYHGKRVSS